MNTRHQKLAAQKTNGPQLFFKIVR